MDTQQSDDARELFGTNGDSSYDNRLNKDGAERGGITVFGRHSVGHKQSSHKINEGNNMLHESSQAKKNNFRNSVVK